jgi:hypothetical protein
VNRTRRARLTLVVLGAAALASLGGAATASAATAPAIGQEWVSQVKSNDATLEALIDPQETSPGAVYQFQLVKEPSEYPLEIQCPPHWGGFSTCVGTHSDTALPIGLIPSTSSQDVLVTLKLASAGITLQSGTTYYYRILSAHRIFTEDTLEWEEPTVLGKDQTFTTLPAEAPSIEGISVSGITTTDATLEAQINPEGLPTTYHFHLASPPCGTIKTCEQNTFSLPSGNLPPSSTVQTVSLDLNSAGVTLSPGERYEYWITATNSAGSAGSQYDANVFAAAEDEIPSIASEGSSHITATDATLEAAINPHGAAAGDYYQFQLARDPSEYASEILCPPTLQPGIDGCIGPQGAALPIGWVPGNLENPLAAQPVHLDLAGAGVALQPGTTYHYRVLVARRVQTEDTIQWEPPTVYGADQTFTTPSGPPPLNSQPSSTGGQPPAIQSPSSVSPSHHRRHRHHRRHKGGLHRSDL